MRNKIKLKWLNKLNDEQLVWAYEMEARDLRSLLNDKKATSCSYKMDGYIKYTYACLNTLKVIAKTRNLKLN